MTKAYVDVITDTRCWGSSSARAFCHELVNFKNQDEKSDNRYSSIFVLLLLHWQNIREAKFKGMLKLNYAKNKKKILWKCFCFVILIDCVRNKNSAASPSFFFLILKRYNSIISFFLHSTSSLHRSQLNTFISVESLVELMIYNFTCA